MKLINRMLITLSLVAALFLAVTVVRADTTHVVEPGDTLFTIALEYGVSMDAIIEANNIVNPRVIRLGRTLLIPGVDGTEGSTPTPAAPAPTRVAPLPPGQLPPHARYISGGVLHTVQPGESLSRISILYNIAMAIIEEANDLTNPRLVYVGQELFIPGVLGQPTPQPTSSPAPAATAAPAATTAPGATAAPSTNLFRNSSFEGDWYYFQFNELQVPVGWQMAYNEDANTLQPGSGGNFNRPEMRVVGKDQLPEEEWAWFIFDSYYALKVFKGDAPTTFSLFQDVHLQPGRYRMILNFFPDIVASFDDGRTFHTDPLSGEVRIIFNDGGTDWTTVTAGQRNSRVYDFTLTRAGGVRLGLSFRNRFETANNGWFLDDWRLERIGN